MRTAPSSRRFTRPFRLVASAGIVLLGGAVNTPSAGASTNVALPYYGAARTLWESEADVVSGALQNVPLVAAVHDLTLGLKVGGANTSGYDGAIATIKAFEGIPLTSETRSQIRQSHRDWAVLNRFFDISPADERVLDDDRPGGPYFNIAQHAFEQEPAGRHHGVNANLLAITVTNLAKQAARPSSRRILYAAAIADLKQLEHATPSDVATSTAALLSPYVQDIYYLNTFFMTSRL